jgi:hypothetical protein
MPQIKFNQDYATFKKGDVVEIYNELASAIVHQEGAAEYVVSVEQNASAKVEEVPTPTVVSVEQNASAKKKVKNNG